MKKGISLLLALALLLTLGVLPASAQSLEGKTIVFTGWGDAAEQQATQNVIDKFTADTGCAVNYIHIPSDYDTKLTAMIAAGEQIDLCQMESGSIAYPLAEQGKFVDLTSFVENDPAFNLDNYVASGNYYGDDGALLTYNGSIELMTVFYAPEVFDDAGVEYPNADPEQAWTWDEFVDVAKKLTKDANGLTPYDEGFDPTNIVRYGVNFGVWWPIWGSMILSNGGDIVDDEGKFVMNSEEATEALQKMADLALVEHCMPTPTAKEGMPGTDIALLTGTYGMVIDGQWTALSIDSAGAKFQMAPLPRMGEKVVSITTAGMYCIMADSKEQEAAWELYKYINDPSLDLTLFKNGNRMPTHYDWLTQPEYLEQWAGEGNTARPFGYDGTIKMLMEYSVPPLTATIKGFSSMIDVVNAEISDVFYGLKTAQEAMDSAAEKIEQAGIVLGKRGV